MTSSTDSSALDASAVARWPLATGAHLLGVGLVAAVLVALPVAPTDLDRHQLPKETVLHLATWLAVVLVRPLPIRLPGRALAAGLLALIAISVASSMLATNPWLAFRALSLTITLIVAFLTARHLATAGLGTTLLGWCMVAAAAGVSTGLGQAYGLTSPLFAAARAPGGTFGNRNFLAHFAALALPLVIAQTLTARGRLRAALGMLLAGALLIAIILTRSRAAWLGGSIGLGVLAASLLIAIVRSRTRRALDEASGTGARLLAVLRAGPLALPIVPGRPLGLGAVLCLGAILAIAVPNTLNWNSDTPYTDTLAGLANHKKGSGEGRMLQYQHSLELTLRHPLLGVGPGNWALRYGETAPPNDPSWVAGDVIPLNPWPSSDWIALLSERGPLAVMAVLLIGMALCLRAWRGVTAGGERAMAAATLVAMLATLCVEGSFDAVALLAAPGALLALSLGALLARADGTTQHEPERLPPRSHWNAALALLLGVIALRSSMQTAAYLVAGNGRIKSRLELAARIDPGSYALRIALANRGSCQDARAALRLAPLWPAPKAAARRCGMRDER